jgi:hypothetical protein
LIWQYQSIHSLKSLFALVFVYCLFNLASLAPSCLSLAW